VKDLAFDGEDRDFLFLLRLLRTGSALALS
jgi:hypothetical protein